MRRAPSPPPRHDEQVRTHAEERRLSLERGERGEQHGPAPLVGEPRILIRKEPAGPLHGQRRPEPPEPLGQVIDFDRGGQARHCSGDRAAVAFLTSDDVSVTERWWHPQRG